MKKRWLAGAALMMGAPAAAQVLPPAQVLQRNPAVNPDRINEAQRRRLEERANPEVATPSRPEVEAPPPAPLTADKQDEVRFTPTAIQFDPSSYLSQAELDALAKPLIGREIALSDLQTLVDRINALYTQRGLTTARAALPAQQIEGGIVRIRLIEGRIGTVGSEGGSARGRARALRAAPAPGSLATPSDLENRLRLFNANNDSQLRARLVPGAAFGTTDVVLTVAEPTRVSADIFFDNNGFSSTGEFEMGGVLRGYRLFSADDRLSLVGIASRGVRNVSTNLSAPLGDRLRVSASASYGRTHVLFGQLADLDVRGSSFSFGGDLSALLLVTDRLSVTGTGSYTTILSKTDIAGRRIIDNEVANTTVGLSSNYAVPGFVASLQYQVTLANVSEQLSGATVKPTLFQGGVALAKVVVPQVQVRLRADWQATLAQNLPGIVQYQIGGPRSSRAFAPGVAAGDQGYSASFELAYGTAWDGLAIEPFAFVDRGVVSVPGSSIRADSAGAGLSLSYSPQIIVRGTLGTSIGRSGGLASSTRAFMSTTFRF